MGRHGTIAGRKAAQDSKRAAMFTKYAKAITVAAKDGGDPDYNAGLRLAIEKARAISMPNDNIQRAIKKGTGELEGVNYEESVFEGYGPGGVAIIVDCLTDNNNRTTSFVRSTFDKYGGNLGTPGCVSYMFSRKGIILIEKEDGMDEDAIMELMEVAIDAGAEDMITGDDNFEIQTDPATYTDVHNSIVKAGYKPFESDIEYVPSMEATPKDEDLNKLKKLIDILEDNDDIQKVHNNCAIDLYE